VNNDFTETIKNNAKIEITAGTYKHDVKAGTADYHVKGALTEKYEATQDTTVTGNLTIKSTGGAIVVSADSKHVYIHGATSIQLQTGESQLHMTSNGNILLKGDNIGITGSAQVNVKGGQILSAATGAHHISGGSVVSEASGSNTVQGGTVLLNP
jgi:hypothetical protein